MATTYPLVQLGGLDEVRVEEIRLAVDAIHYRVSFPAAVAKVSFAGFVPTLTLPGHDPEWWTEGVVVIG